MDNTQQGVNGIMSLLFDERGVKKSFSAYPYAENGGKYSKACRVIIESYVLFIVKQALFWSKSTAIAS